MSMMTSVIRIKRKRNAEPVGSLLLARKRIKHNDTATESGNWFRFAGTVEASLAHQNEIVSDHVKKAIDQQKFYGMKNPLLDSVRNVSKRRASEPLTSEPTKLKVLNSQTFTSPKMNKRRSIQTQILDKILKPHDNKSSHKAEVTKKEVMFSTSPNRSLHSVFDLSNHSTNETKENDLMCNNIKMLREKLTISDQTKTANCKDEYVYDLYYCDNVSKDWDMGDMLYVQPYQHDSRFRSVSSSEYQDDDSDSNDEGNWRNDYPDEESSESSSTEQERLMIEEEDEIERDEMDSDCESLANDGFGGGMGDDDGKYRTEDREEFDYYDDFEDDQAFENEYEDYTQHDDHNDDDCDNDNDDF